MKKKDKRQGPRSPEIRKKMSLAQKRRRRKAQEWFPEVDDKLAAVSAQRQEELQKDLYERAFGKPTLVQSIVVGLKSVLGGLWR